MFRFDDGSNTQYDPGGYLASKGMVATYGIIGSAVGDSGILTIAQIRDLQDQGHLIANHGWTTDKWDDMSVQQIRDNLTKNAEWMCKNGFTQGARIVISPGGRWPQYAKPVLDELADFVWLVNAAPNLARIETFYSPNTQRGISETVDTEPSSTVAEAFVDNAITDNGIMTMFYHAVAAGDMTTKFQSFADDVAGHRDAGELSVITPIDLLSLNDDMGFYDLKSTGVFSKTDRGLGYITKTVSKTINLDSSDDNDDFEFDDTQTNVTEQTRNLGAIIPAYAEIVSAQVRCFETVAGSGSAVMALDLGTSDGGAEILATADTDTANDINSSAAGTAPEMPLIATASARSVWINATPTANWSTLTAGRWNIMVTYRDYGALHTNKNP